MHRSTIKSSVSTTGRDSVVEVDPVLLVEEHNLHYLRHGAGHFITARKQRDLVPITLACCSRHGGEWHQVPLEFACRPVLKFCGRIGRWPRPAQRPPRT